MDEGTKEREGSYSPSREKRKKTEGGRWEEQEGQADCLGGKDAAEERNLRVQFLWGRLKK